MIGLLKKLFGGGGNYAELVAKGAVIVDVRTPSEFAAGHVKGSLNIPLNNLGAQLSRLNKSKPVIVCCASGMRSASAKGILQKNGFEAYNGGSWMNLKKYSK